MFKPKVNQRGSLIVIELVFLAVVLAAAGFIGVKALQHRADVVKNVTTKQPQSKTSSQLTPTQTSTTPESLNTAPPLAGSGIKGQIYVGAATGCYSTDPNSSCGKARPQAGTVIIKGPNGIIQAVKSNSTGFFLVSANPGTYTVDLQTGGSATTVEVKTGIYSEVTLYVN